MSWSRELRDQTPDSRAHAKETTTMCDYSLQGLPNRLAEEGEQLVTYRFRTGSIGMASPTEIGVRPAPRQQPVVQRSWWEAFKAWMAGPLESDDVCDVCVAPGTRLLM